MQKYDFVPRLRRYSVRKLQPIRNRQSQRDYENEAPTEEAVKKEVIPPRPQAAEAKVPKLELNVTDAETTHHD